ncbi:MAG: DUF4097 family beta strand repeat protein [Chloroflexi bacterium]|nr:DUF4097 family beta strand repeat protein [Chloroflexota bacterium]
MAQSFSVSEQVRIEIRGCRDRVTVMGWDDVRSVVTDVAARQDGDSIFVEEARRVGLRVPRTASVSIADCDADVRVEGLAGRVELASIDGDVVLRGLTEAVIRDLDGDLVAKGVGSLTGAGRWDGDAALRGIEQLQIAQVEGDASLGDVGTVTIETIEGDLNIRGLRGALRLGQVDGDVTLHDAAGDLNLARVDGDFVAQGVRGNVDAPEIDGDAVLSLDEVKGVLLRADGDVVLNLPIGTNAEIELDVPHGDWVARAGIRIIEQDEHHMRGTLGSGGPKVQLESLHDDIVVRAGGIPGPRAEFSEEFRAPFVEMGQEMAEMGQRIAQEVRQSVHESLTRSGFRSHGSYEFRHHRKRRHQHHAPEETVEPEPSGPVAGSPERRAILDAIARGELSVDDAIRKLRGEE